jgi:uncharacterized repeat protein (TIGR03847 family)
MNIELGPVDRITADAIGPPGERTFFIQGRKDDRIVSVLVEKQQVQLLAASVVDILTRIAKVTGEGPAEEAMALDEPVIPEWRVGRLEISYLEDDDLVVLEAEELVPEQEGDDDDGDEGPPLGAGAVLRPGPDAPDETVEPSRVRFYATREQMLALARHGAEVCSRGRPICRFCEQPMDPEGHICAKMNGHRSLEDE